MPYILGAEYLPLNTDPNALDNLCSANYITGPNVILNKCSKNVLTVYLNAANESNVESFIEIPLLYYKGYHAISNSDHTQLTICSGKNGVIRVQLPANYSGDITVKFQEPCYWRMSEIYSAITLLEP